MSLLEIRNLKKYFSVGSGFFSRQKGDVRAVDGVTLEVEEVRHWGWWENQGAENPLWAGASSG